MKWKVLKLVLALSDKVAEIIRYIEQSKKSGRCLFKVPCSKTSSLQSRNEVVDAMTDDEIVFDQTNLVGDIGLIANPSLAIPASRLIQWQKIAAAFLGSMRYCRIDCEWGCVGRRL